MAYNVPGIRRFASPDKGLRSKTRAGKMWVEGGVGMERSHDLAVANPEPPKEAKQLQSCYAKLFCPLTTQ